MAKKEAKYPQDHITPYNAKEKKSVQVERMFDNIAPAYDKLNHTLSFGIDRYWRRKAINRLSSFSPEYILDVATGTGDFALQSYRKIRPLVLTATDISEGMMEVGRQKVLKAGLKGKITFRKEDCQALTFGDDSFDAVTVAFGIRNFEQLDTCLKEMRRVLRRNGKLVVLELTTPQSFPIKQLYNLYSKVMIPTLGRLMAKDKEAYKYLPATIKAFPQGEQMRQILLNAGFRKATYKRLTFGICTLYEATK